jgi:hypothetical protein
VRHTIAKRMRAKLAEIKEALNPMRHVPLSPSPDHETGGMT